MVLALALLIVNYVSIYCFYLQIVDFKGLDKAVKDAKSVVVVGGGFLGSELACALGHRGTCTEPHILVYHQSEEPLLIRAS